MVGIAPLIGFLGLMAVIVYRTQRLGRRGIRSIADIHDSPLRDRLIKRSSMIVWWAFGAAAFIYAFNSHPTWMPSFLSYQIHDLYALHIMGAVMCLAGAAIYPFAQSDMGDFWRIGIDRDVGRITSPDGKQTGLVTTGLFAWSRNPIYILNDAVFVGGFLVHGQVIFLVLAVAYVTITHLEIIEEEKFLRVQFGDDYASYSTHVGRYIFGL